MYSLALDPVDWRDIPYESTTQPRRPQVDLRRWASRVEDQLDLGSCTGAAVIGAYELLLNKNYPDQFVDLSSLFVYYNARVLEGYAGDDAGAYIRSAIRATHKYGVCSESCWPYKIADYAVVPPVACYVDAVNRKIKNYFRLSTVDDMLDALNNDIPVVVGMSVYEEFAYVSYQDPVLQLPTEAQPVIGGHAVCLVGYDVELQQFLARNSFGTDWGRLGYFWIPFKYAETNVHDKWVFEISLTQKD